MGLPGFGSLPNLGRLDGEAGLEALLNAAVAVLDAGGVADLGHAAADAGERAREVAVLAHDSLSSGARSLECSHSVPDPWNKAKGAAVPFAIVRNNIARMRSDVVVNAANEQLLEDGAWRGRARNGNRTAATQAEG